MRLRFRDIIQRIKKRIQSAGLFERCIYASIMIHVLAYSVYYIATYQGEVSSEDIKITNVEVDFEEIPSELLGGSSSPAHVDKREWIEGTSKIAPDAVENEYDINAISGDGTDKDGYLFSYNGDRPPTAIINFDIKKYFPEEAKRANITSKVVYVLIQVDEKGILKSAKLTSGKAGYGFDEAAMKIVNRVRFAPGYVSGKPTRMTHKLPITFVLED